MGKFKHKVLSFKAFDIASNLAFEVRSLYFIDACQIEIEHHALTSYEVNLGLDVL